MDPAQPPGGQVRGALATSWHREPGERAAPFAGQPREAGGSQPAAQRALLDDPAPGQVLVERLEFGWRGGHQGSGHLTVVQQVDVEIPGGRGQVAQPLELRTEPGRQAGGQHVPGDLERGPGPPDRNPQVVQVLGVDVTDGAGHVGLKGVQQLQQDGLQGGPGGHARAEPDADLVAVSLGALAGGGEGGVQRAARVAIEPGRGGQQLADPLGLGLVATHRGDLQPGRQLGRRRVVHRGPVHPDPGDRLGVRVEDPQILDGAGGPGHGQQGPDPGHRADHGGHRARRQVLGQHRPGQPACGLADLVPGRRGQHQLRRPRAGHVLQGESGPVQPPVERIQPGPAHVTWPAAGAEREPGRERGQHVAFAGQASIAGRQLGNM